MNYSGNPQGNKLTISGKNEGNILPDRIQNMNRQVTVKKGAYISGSLFGGDVVFRETPFYLEKALCALRELTFENVSSNGVIASSVFSKKAILVENVERNNEGWISISGDVHTEIANLKRCFIYGDIFAKNIKLDQCCVLGLIHGTGSIDLKNALVGSFYSPEVSVGENIVLLNPYAMAENFTEFSSPVTCLAFSDLRKMFESQGFQGDQGNGAFTLSGEDFRDISYEQSLDGESRQVALKSLGIGARVLSGISSRAAVKSNNMFIQELLMKDKIDCKGNHPEDIDSRYMNIEKRMMRYILKRTAGTAAGKPDISNPAEQSGNIDYRPGSFS